MKFHFNFLPIEIIFQYFSNFLYTPTKFGYCWLFVYVCKIVGVFVFVCWFLYYTYLCICFCLLACVQSVLIRNIFLSFCLFRFWQFKNLKSAYLVTQTKLKVYIPNLFFLIGFYQDPKSGNTIFFLGNHERRKLE